MKRIVVLMFLCFLLSACADSKDIIRVGGSVLNNKKLTADDSFYISIPADGTYGATTYSGSGTMTSRLLLSAFSKRARNVQMAKTPQGFKDDLQAAREGNLGYLVYPTIMHWEDRATEWSGKPDRVEVKVEVFETPSGSLFDSVIIKGRSGLATFGGDHPQDLLPDPMEEFVTSLFQ